MEVRDTPGPSRPRYTPCIRPRSLSSSLSPLPSLPIRSRDTPPLFDDNRSAKRPLFHLGYELDDDGDDRHGRALRPRRQLRGGGRAQHHVQKGDPTKRPVVGGGRKKLTRSQARRQSSPSISADLETIAQEDKAVRHELSRLNLGLRDVQGDGNCLFRALADQLWGVQKRHVEVRKLVCDYLQTNKQSMEAFVWPFLKEGESYEGYVERMRQPKQFGSHIEIQAAARVFRRNIRVVMSTTSFTIPWETESSQPATPAPQPPPIPSRRRTRSTTVSLLSNPAIHPPSSSSYATALADYIPSVRPGRTLLWLALFSLAEHFQSIRRKGDGDSGPAEIEDRLCIPHEQDQSEAARIERGETVKGRSAPSAKVSQVFASLPPGHGISAETVEGVLARVKGDLGEAVEILLEDIDHETSSNDATSDQHVEQLLQPPYRERSSSPSSFSDAPSSRTSVTSKMTTPETSPEPKPGIVRELDGLNVVPVPTPTSVTHPPTTRSLRARTVHAQ